MNNLLLKLNNSFNSKFKNILPYILICILSVLNYAPYLNNAFAVDDYDFLDNKYAEKFQHFSDFFTQTATQHFIPIYYLINTTLFKFFHHSPIIPRIFNLNLFILDTSLLFLFLNLLTRNYKLALTASLLFCVHPYQSDAVNWITANFLFIFSICMKSSLIFLWLGSTYQSNKTIYFILSVFTYIISLLTFEGTLLYPLYAFLILFFLTQKKFNEIVKICLPFILIAALYLVFYTFVCRDYPHFNERIQMPNLTLSNFTATFGRLFGWYILNLFIPLSIVFMKNYSLISNNLIVWNILLVVLIASLGWIIIKRWKRGLKSFAVLWFLVGLILVLPASLAHTYIGIVIEPHWLYFSSIGFFVLSALVILDIETYTGKKIYWVMMLSLVFFFSLITHKYNILFKTEQSYCQFWDKYSPNNPIPLYCLGMRTKDPHQASEYLFKAMSLDKKNQKDEIYANIALIQLNRGNLEEAQQMITTALNDNPSYSFAHIVQGSIFVSDKKYSQAEQAFIQALESPTPNTEAALYLIELYLTTKQTNKASSLYTKLPNLKLPAQELQSVLCRLALAFYIENDMPSYNLILAEMTDKIKNGSGFIELAMLFINRDILAPVLSILQKALELYPNDKEIYLFTGIFYANHQDYSNAIRLWENGLKLSPNDKRFKDNIRQAQNLLHTVNGKN